VDILRGLAIFGILTINAYYFGHPWFLGFDRFVEITGVGHQAGPIDRAVHAVVFFLSNDMLYSLFAFLFAAGMATLMTRAQARGTPFVRLYVRRLLVLLAFGVCHIVFFWAGDILSTFAILGFLLLAFRERADSTLLAWASVCLLIGVVGFAGLVVLTKTVNTPATAEAMQPVPTGSPSPTPALPATPTSTTAMENATLSAEDLERRWTRSTYQTYAQGTYGQILLWRVADFVTWTAVLVFIQYPRVFGMFLLGLWAGRRGILQDIPAHLGFIRKIAVWAAIVGVASSLFAIAMRWYHDEELISLCWSGLAAFAGDSIRIPSLCVASAAAIVLLVQSDDWRRRLNPLAAVGRMSLSNYLLQSVICSFLFYGYGLGLYGKLGPTACLLLAVVIFLVQMPLSVLWLRHLRFGPAEWLWRTLTYGQLQPMRLPDAISSNQRVNE